VGDLIDGAADADGGEDSSVGAVYRQGDAPHPQKPFLVVDCVTEGEDLLHVRLQLRPCAEGLRCLSDQILPLVVAAALTCGHAAEKDLAAGGDIQGEGVPQLVVDPEHLTSVDDLVHIGDGVSIQDRQRRTESRPLGDLLQIGVEKLVQGQILPDGIAHPEKLIGEVVELSLLVLAGVAVFNHRVEDPHGRAGRDAAFLGNIIEPHGLAGEGHSLDDLEHPVDGLIGRVFLHVGTPTPFLLVLFYLPYHRFGVYARISCYR